jgi:hypothetical protein
MGKPKKKKKPCSKVVKDRNTASMDIAALVSKLAWEGSRDCFILLSFSSNADCSCPEWREFPSVNGVEEGSSDLGFCLLPYLLVSEKTVHGFATNLFSIS